MIFSWFRGISKKEELTPERYNKTWYRFEKFWNDHDSGVDKWTAINTSGIIGVSDGSDAAAGNVGEFLRSYVSSAVSSPSSGSYFDVTHIAIPAGDWDVSGIIAATANGATVTFMSGGIWQTAGNITTGAAPGDNYYSTSPPTAISDSGVSIPAFRVSLTTQVTYYLKADMFYSGGTPQAYGRISARRIR